MNRVGTTAILICILASGIYAQRTTPVIRQIDHLLIESSDPKALFQLFADKLQLPTPWPFRETGQSLTGWIGVGDVNVEIFGYADRKRSGRPKAGFSGIAFEPYPLEDALRRLQSLRIPYSPPEPTMTTLPSGSRGVGWTTVGLTSVSKPGMFVFLYEYSPAFLKVDVRRKQMANRLMLNDGGPLGIKSVGEVVIGSTHLKEDTAAWSLLIGKPAQSGRLAAGNGPAIRLVQDNEDRIREIVFEVGSVDRTKAFLRQNKLLGASSGSKTYLSPSSLQGLSVSFAREQ